VERLYLAKQRPPDKAIPILLADPGDIEQVAAEVPDAARRLADAFWPGPLTIAVPKRSTVSEIVSAFATVGVRVPDHTAARAVIRACGGALAVTSANRSGEASPLTAQEAAHALGASISLVLDGGLCPGGVPSTVVDISRGDIQIIRPGPISENDLRLALG
jgi:L-threonylcarbamoyladenylate synthase